MDKLMDHVGKLEIKLWMEHCCENFGWQWCSQRTVYVWARQNSGSSTGDWEVCSNIDDLFGPWSGYVHGERMNGTLPMAMHGFCGFTFAVAHYGPVAPLVKDPKLLRTWVWPTLVALQRLGTALSFNASVMWSTLTFHDTMATWIKRCGSHDDPPDSDTDVPSRRVWPSRGQIFVKRMWPTTRGPGSFWAWDLYSPKCWRSIHSPAEACNEFDTRTSIDIQGTVPSVLGNLDDFIWGIALGKGGCW